MTLHLELRDAGQLWLALGNGGETPVDLQAIGVTLGHGGQEFEEEVLPYAARLAPAAETALNLTRFVGMHLRTQRARPGTPVTISCLPYAFDSTGEAVVVSAAVIAAVWQGENFAPEEADWTRTSSG